MCLRCCCLKFIHSSSLSLDSLCCCLPAGPPSHQSLISASVGADGIAAAVVAGHSTASATAVTPSATPPAAGPPEPPPALPNANLGGICMLLAAAPAPGFLPLVSDLRSTLITGRGSTHRRPLLGLSDMLLLLLLLPLLPGPAYWLTKRPAWLTAADCWADDAAAAVSPCATASFAHLG